MLTSFALALQQVVHRGDQRRLARELGVSDSTVSGWVAGKHVPPVEDAVRIEEFLELDPGQLTVHLGFLPLSAGTVNLETPEAAVIADSTLSGRDKRLILELIARVRDEKP